MNRSIRASACVFVCLLPLMIGAGKEQPRPRPIERAETVLAIYPEDWGLASAKPVSAIVLAIWPDGHIVWSKDRLHGGAPYFTGRIDPEDVSALLSRFEHDGLFADKKLNWAHFGPDSDFTTLLVKSGKKQLKMQSWHELYEDGGKAIVGHHGARGLDGRRRLEALRDEPAEYLHYRFVWSETRGRLIDLIPNDGKPISGRPVVDRGGVSWQQEPAG